MKISLNATEAIYKSKGRLIVTAIESAIIAQNGRYFNSTGTLFIFASEAYTRRFRYDAKKT
jgi:hypothetical protein